MELLQKSHANYPSGKSEIRCVFGEIPKFRARINFHLGVLSERSLCRIIRMVNIFAPFADQHAACQLGCENCENLCSRNDNLGAKVEI